MTDTTSRRAFLAASATLGAAGLLPATRLAAASDQANPRARLGMFHSLRGNPAEALDPVAGLGLPLCELYLERFDDEVARALREGMKRQQVQIVTLFTMGPGQQRWDFVDGPRLNGLVPREFRQARVERLKQASDFARALGVPAIETHCGAIPEDPSNPLYGEMVAALKDVVGHCRANGQTFLYHAGQESPVAMLRTIEDVGLDNQGVGLDTANGLMYGSCHPADALEVYGQHVYSICAKDALWPTDPRRLGREVPIGEGLVDFPRVFRKLAEIGYKGNIIIERETSGPQQIEDIRKSIGFLEDLMRANS